MAKPQTEFWPTEEEARSRHSFRPAEDGTVQAVRLEGGATGSELVTLLTGILAELRAIALGINLLVGEDLHQGDSK